MQTRFLLLLLGAMSGLLFFTSCSDDDMDDMDDEETSFEETYHEVIWQGEEVEFDRLINGTIPGGESTQLWLDNDDYTRELVMRWGRDIETDEYFNDPPSVTLELENEDGDVEEYRIGLEEDFSNFEIITNGDDVIKAEGSIELRASNPEAMEINPDGGLLEVDIQVGE